MSVYELCPGINCPLKLSCRRYRETIDTQTEYHFPYTPYDHVKKKCSHQDKVTIDEKALANYVKDIIK
jgi:hypothetical protein